MLHRNIDGHFDTEAEAKAWCEEQLKEDTKEI